VARHLHDLATGVSCMMRASPCESFLNPPPPAEDPERFDRTRDLSLSLPSRRSRASGGGRGKRGGGMRELCESTYLLTPALTLPRQGGGIIVGVAERRRALSRALQSSVRQAPRPLEKGGKQAPLRNTNSTKGHRASAGRPVLARITHEPPAATAAMAVLPGVLGSRTLRRTEQVRLRFESRGAAGWLPGGTTSSTVSRRRLVHNAG